MESEPVRRDLLVTMAKSFAVVGAGAGLYAVLRASGGPSDVQNRPTMDIELGTLPVGTARTVNWQGVPIMIRHRPFAEVEQARATDGASRRDTFARNDNLAREVAPTDANRAAPDARAWIVQLGVCTHNDCMVREVDHVTRITDRIGWICPCCASRYDLSGRIVSGPAQQNLRIPRYGLRANTLTLR